MNMTGNSDRGLASADKQTRERVAREGGKASHGGGREGESSEDEGSKMTREEAAAKGGRASHSGGRKD